MFGEFRISIMRTTCCFAMGRKILVGRGFRIIGLQNVALLAGARLSLGTLPYGFADSKERGILRIRGRLSVAQGVAIGVGSRLDVGSGAKLEIGENTYLSPGVKVIITKGLLFGNGCAVGWNAQFLDSDFHQIGSIGEPFSEMAAPIKIGHHVWIGSHAKVFKGVTIADGCVVAGNSTVTKSFEIPNSLIGGTPARVLRANIRWR
ncbi:acyltransferase [Cryobacterium sp. GrIS_2_6]|uniref:acyltransferase n=1 Tax=Cryobacterium sp. GrIS_2_6 TaxID=3162785 RepID=UPI002E022CA9|nr:acetyltransferase-like isoleucine patch superfamily enzyme [Cryobacterium psychrotolerans]